MSQRTVSTSEELLAALDEGSRDIRVAAALAGMPSIRLAPGTRLRGGRLSFGAKGIVLTSDNEVENIEITCPVHEVSISNGKDLEDLGTLVLNGVRTTGQVLLQADGAVRRGTVLIDGLVVTQADLRGRETRPHGYGVDVLQGALTIWNRQPDPESVLEVTLRGISAGSVERPIRGSGVFVGGLCDDTGVPTGGRVEAQLVECGDVVIDGGIPAGTPDLISGGVFVQAGANVASVLNTGWTTTYGPNDMALDNWGQVARWSCHAPVTTRGPSGIGFVNFGDLKELDVRAPIETFGVGARGFNLYDGTLQSATFHSITTHGDGAVGIQVTKPLPRLAVRQNVTTSGAKGISLVRGKQVELQAIALSVKEGGYIGDLQVGGQVKTTGNGVVSLEVRGAIDVLKVGGGIVAEGEKSDAVHVVQGQSPVLSSVSLSARSGETLVTIDG